MIVVALDVSEKHEFIRLLDFLAPEVDVFKIGLEFFLKHQFWGVDEVRKRGKKVFLDLKLHDIPNTVRKAVNNLRGRDIFSISVHLSGGKRMLEAAKESAAGEFYVWGVSVLTSLDEDECKYIFNQGAKEQVLNMSELAKEVALDGLICSPKELEVLGRQKIQLICPGIRMVEDAVGDQKRIMDPKKARSMGANYLVVGRPITSKADPLSSFKLYRENYLMGGASVSI